MKKMVGLLQEWATPGMNRSHNFVIFKNWKEWKEILTCSGTWEESFKQFKK
jgi:hypothetical protein